MAYKDVFGKTIPKTRRGRLAGWISASAMLVGAGLAWFWASEQSVVYAIILAAGAVFWFVAAAVYAKIIEYPGETGLERSSSGA